MPITVVCPGCRKSFKVSDKFAGKKGPCPKCKTVIEVPDKVDEVVIHEPENFGPTDSKGRAVLKPIARTEAKFSPLLTAVIIVAILAAVSVAWMFRSPEGEAPTILLLVGAVLLAPPLAWGGYAFLRDDELEPYRGTAMLIRTGICALVYALLWGLVALVKLYVFEGDDLEVVHMVFIAPAMVVIGAFTAFATLELEFGMGAIHYAFYLAATVILRLIMGLSAI
jgi:hypothetical protein